MELIENILMMFKELIWGFLTSIEINGTPIMLAALLWSIAIIILIKDLSLLTRKQKK